MATSNININIPDGVSIVPVDTRPNLKILSLPAANLHPGRFLLFKDYYGTSAISSFTLSTIGIDTIDGVRSYYTFSNMFGSLNLLSDGINSWRTIGYYDGTLTQVAPLSVIPALRYSFESSNYSGTGAVTNIGSNASIGSGTVVRNSYTAAVGFITNIRPSQYVLGASITGLRTVIIICRIRDTTSPSYFLDGRPGMPNGWIYDTMNGTDWNGVTYYRDAASFTFSLPNGANDSLWHHHCLITTATFTSAMTFGNRFSFTEGLGCDIGEIMVFTQVLTPQQVKDNYNFFAARFGLSYIA